jgi:hypothetical protein
MYDEVVKKCFKCKEPRLFKVHRKEGEMMIPVHWTCLNCFQENDSMVTAKALDDEN